MNKLFTRAEKILLVVGVAVTILGATLQLTVGGLWGIVTTIVGVGLFVTPLMPTDNPIR